MIRTLFSLLAYITLLGLGPAPAHAQAQLDNIVILMDASGSMTNQRLRDGQLNWTMAKNHSATLLLDLAKEPNKSFSVVHFGANQPSFGVCTQDVAQPMGPATEANAKSAIGTIRNWTPNGKTSLAAGLEIAWEELEPTGGTIVVFTDFESDNCGGDPCNTVRRLMRQRNASLPPIEIRYVIAIGAQGFRTSRAFGNCSGAQTLPALKDEDIKPNVDEIIGSLRREPDAEVAFSMSVLDPTGLGVALPAQTQARLFSGTSQPVSLSFNATRTVQSDKSQIEVILPFSDGFDSGEFSTPKGSKSNVRAYFTPPLVVLRLPNNVRTDSAKWSIKHAQSQKRYLLTGPQVEQYLPPGDYEVQVWSGESLLTYVFTAEWNTATEHLLPL